jgi:periplasmic divalent cation tolerance protein
VTPFPIEAARAMGPMRLVISSYPSLDAARAAIDGALAQRLAACASAHAVDSRYWWNDKIEDASETLVVFKTVPKRVGALFRYLREHHPYDLPEIIEVDVPRVDPGYLAYLGRTLDAHALEVPSGPRPRRRGAPRARGAPPPGRTQAPHRRLSR